MTEAVFDCANGGVRGIGGVSLLVSQFTTSGASDVVPTPIQVVLVKVVIVTAAAGGGTSSSRTSQAAAQPDDGEGGRGE